MKYTLWILFLFAAFTVKAQEAIRFPLLKARLDSLAKTNRQTGQDVRYGKIEKRDSLRKIVRETFIRNTAIIKQLFAEYGFPNYDKVGKEAEKSFCLCVQHSDSDLEFQQAVLGKMKREVKRKKADPLDFAYLTDRVNINSGKAQVYGTQLDYDKNKTAYPKNLTDPENVNKRRKSIGIEPIEDYLQFATEAHRQMNPGE